MTKLTDSWLLNMELLLDGQLQMIRDEIARRGLRNETTLAPILDDDEPLSRLRTSGKLTTGDVTNAKLNARLGDGNGLWLFVDGKGNKNWRYRFTSPQTRKAREMGLGSFPDVTLNEARNAADDARKLVHRDLDPIEHRKTLRESRYAAANC